MFLDEIEEKLWKERGRLAEEEEAFEQYMEFLLYWVDLYKAMSDEEVLACFREDGGDPEVGVEEARRAMLESLVVDRWWCPSGKRAHGRFLDDHDHRTAA